MKKLFSCQQKEKEDLTSYRWWFEERSEAVKTLIGNDIFDRFVEKSQGYAVLSDKIEKENYKQETWERFIANGLMYNCDIAKYQSRMDTMRAQYALKHLDFDQRCTFPTTLENAVDMLSLHKHDNRKKRNNGGGQQPNGKNKGNDGSQFSQKRNRACFVCGDFPKEKWVKPEFYKDYSASRNQQNMQRDDDDSNGSNDDTNENDGNVYQWKYQRNNRTSGTQHIQRGNETVERNGMIFFQNRRYNDVHIDSASTFNLRKSVDDMQDIRWRNIPGGFHYASNIGGRNLDCEEIDKLFNLPCKLDTNATNNINILSAMVKAGFIIFMDTERANSFFCLKAQQYLAFWPQ